MSETPAPIETIESKVKIQNTLRFREEELKHIREHLPDFNFADDIRFSDMWLKIFDMALNKRPTQSQPADLEKIKELTLQVEELAADKTRLENDLSAAMQTIANGKLPDGAMILNFPAEKREYFWGVLEMLKLNPKSKVETFEDLFTMMLEVFQFNGWLILKDEDLKYLETLKQQQS